MKLSRKTSQGRSGWVECDISTEWREGEAVQVPQGKSILGRGSRKCKGPEAKASSECAGFRTCIGAHGEHAGWSLEE